MVNNVIKIFLKTNKETDFQISRGSRVQTHAEANQIFHSQRDSEFQWKKHDVKHIQMWRE